MIGKYTRRHAHADNPNMWSRTKRQRGPASFCISIRRTVFGDQCHARADRASTSRICVTVWPEVQLIAALVARTALVYVCSKLIVWAMFQGDYSRATSVWLHYLSDDADRARYEETGLWCPDSYFSFLAADGLRNPKMTAYHFLRPTGF